MSADLPVFPPDAQCFLNSSDSTPCVVTNEMISFLNLSEVFYDYFEAYCLNPPPDDECPYGYCPNEDIAGVLIRLSAYLTNILVATLIFYKPTAVKETIWSQIITIYSILLTSGFTILKRQLSRFHAVMATALVGSPLSLYLVIYAIRSIIGNGNRLTPVFSGPKRIFPLTLVLVAFPIWISLIIYIYHPNHVTHFTQHSCEAAGGDELIKLLFGLPLVLLVTGLFSPLLSWAVTLPIQLTVLAWIIAIYLRRRRIWSRDDRWTLRIWNVWRVVCDNYPFIQFVSVVVLPFSYWAFILEIGALHIVSNDDNQVSTKFAQILAVFVTLPPLVQVVMLTPRFIHWFIGLTWVRFLTRRLIPQKLDSQKEPTPRLALYNLTDEAAGVPEFDPYELSKNDS